jgi:polysaccharide export outer membrane protein
MTKRLVTCAMLALTCHAFSAGAQTRPAAAAGNAASAAAPATPPPGYVIGPQDELRISVWGEERFSGDVVVRPDGQISLPLLNDISAAGATPEELAERITKAASQYVESPKATVIVRAINSQQVFITGNVGNPGMHPLRANMTVLQLIAVAGGLLEFADAEKILIVRPAADGRAAYLKFNYKDVVKQKNVQQNVVLAPGDTVVVP